MAYEVTATRRRPQAFENLVGQEFVAETLKNSINSKKIANAYLFTGPRGCGKTSTARILAKALNCANGPTATPCGKCPQCMEITKGACPDVIEIDGASNTSVDDARQIKDEILFPPQSCKYKIYIIDEVHMLTVNAFNALLKTIEEPPPYVIFIFATTELQKVPATIKSRCQQYNFRLVAIDKVKEQLALAAQEIGIKAQDEALYWIARESTGSMRDAYTLFDQVAAFSGDEITYDKIRDKLGLVGVDTLNAIFEDCANNKTQEALLKLDVFLQAGLSIDRLILNSTDYLRSLLLIKNGITKEGLLGQSKDRFSQIVLQKWNSIQIERGMSLLLQLYRDIRYSLNPRYELELAFSRLSWLSEYVSPAEVKVAIEKARSLLEGQSVQPTAQNSQPLQHTQNQQMNFASMAPVAPSMPPVNTSNVNEHLFSNPSHQMQNQVPKPTPPTFTFSNDNAEVANPFLDGGAVPPEQTAFDNPFESQSNGGAKQPPSDLKQAIVDELTNMNEIALVANILETSDWKIDADCVHLKVNTLFQKERLQKNIALLQKIVSSLYNKQLQLDIQIAQKTVKKVTVVPKEVDLLINVFRGELVGFVEKTEDEKQQQKISENLQTDHDEQDEQSESDEIID